MKKEPTWQQGTGTDDVDGPLLQPKPKPKP